jgi:hypothetical protein
MDHLYYSTNCNFSQRVLQHITKTGLIDKISCISIDKRQRDHNNNHIFILLENGKKVILPPNIQSVPALLRVNKNYTVILGDSQIIEYLNSQYGNQQLSSPILQMNGEPASYMFDSLGGGAFSTNILSEKYTDYNASPEDLYAKGNSKTRNLHNYVPATHEITTIQAPPETYKPDKIPRNLTLEVIEQKRAADIPMNPTFANNNGAGGMKNEFTL